MRPYGDQVLPPVERELASAAGKTWMGLFTRLTFRNAFHVGRAASLRPAVFIALAANSATRVPFRSLGFRLTQGFFLCKNRRNAAGWLSIKSGGETELRAPVQNWSAPWIDWEVAA